MPDLVINTGPLIALVAATGSLEILTRLYNQILVPGEVEREILAGGPATPEHRAMIEAAHSLRTLPVLDAISPELANQLDLGEASVIQNARQGGIPLVAIDEKAGRRIARLHGLVVTGSLGILIKARKQGQIGELSACVHRMNEKGIWISDTLVRQALTAVGEGPGPRG
jgi:predicted nucleic acid-binding protein